MTKIIAFLRKHKFQTHTLAFALMCLSALGMLFRAGEGDVFVLMPLILLFALVNLVLLLVR